MIRWENRSKVKKAGLIGLACGMLFLTACGGNKDSGSYDVISQKKVEEGRTAVTILVGRGRRGVQGTGGDAEAGRLRLHSGLYI